MQRVASLLLLVMAWVLLSACSPGGGAAPPPQDQEDAVSLLGSALDWDRSPDTVLVRLDTAGGTGNPADDLNVIPFCTVFGDGHVVWVDPYADPEQVLEDRVSEQRIRSFLEYVIGTGFYSWDPETGFLPPSTELPFEGPIVEQITLTLYGETRTLNAFSNWPRDAFANILERCRQLSDAPVLYLPTGAWLSAIPVEMRSDIPSLPWSSFEERFPDLDLSAATLENPRWVTGELAGLVWNIARAGRMQVTAGDSAYRLVVQVPRIQPHAPPAPEGG